MGANFSLGEAILGTAVDLKGLADGVKKAQSSSQGFIDGFAGQLMGLGKVAAGVGATLAAALAGGAVALAIEAAPVEGIAGAFEGTAASIGSSLEEMQAAFDEATAGMVSHRDAMLTFNEAAQLVSKDFAAGLPEAMALLGKVSAATGKDMSYLMDSLVTGIGRLSGPILDNLAIQTDATAAYEAYAEALGKSADELTKNEQQMALFEQVMARLRENTASMPDATDTTAASLARFGATIQNLKDDIGVQLLPVLQPFLDIAVDLGQAAIPLVTDALEDVAPIATDVANAFGGFVKGIEGGMTPLESFERQIKSLFPHDTVEKIMNVAGVIDRLAKIAGGLIHTLATGDVTGGFLRALDIQEDHPFVGFLIKVHEILSQVRLQDLLIGLGVAIASFVVPALVTVVTAAAPIIGIFLLVAGAVATLRTAWVNDFGGIRTALVSAWAQIQPALQQLGAALGLDTGNAAGVLAGIVQGALLPALMGIVTLLVTHIIPAAADVVVWFAANLPAAFAFVNSAVQVLVGIWQSILLPALQGAGNFISTTLMPFLAAMGNLFSAVIGVAVAYAAQMFNSYLLPAIQAVGKFIKSTFKPILEEIGEFLGHKFAGSIGKVSVFVEGLKVAFQGVINILQTLTNIANAAAEALRGVKPDPSMIPGSPPPFEVGIRRVTSALKDMNRNLPAFLSQGLQLETAPAMEGLMAGGPLAEGGLILHNYGQITVQDGGAGSEPGITSLIRQFKDVL